MKPVLSALFIITSLCVATISSSHACLCFRRPTNLEKIARRAKHFPIVRRVSLPATNQKMLTPIEEEKEPEANTIKWCLKKIFGEQ